MSAVLAFRTRAVPEDFASLQNKLEIYQRALREWAGYLTGNELAVLEVLIDRTVGWGRREAYFTIRALIDGDGVYSGINISRRTAFRVLSRLEEAGVIRRRKDLNVPDRVHFTVNLDWKSDVVNIPKRLQKAYTQCQDGTDRCHLGTTQCQDGTLYTDNHLQVSTTDNHTGAAAPLSLTASKTVREIATMATRANRTRLAIKAQKPQAEVDAVDATWRLALIDTFPGTAYRSWGIREKAQIKTVLKTWRGDCTFPEFVDWAVRNWVAIVKKHFKWMTKLPAPLAPSLSFLIAFVGKFADARAEGVLLSWQSSDERTRMERLMAQGQTYEQANAQIAKDKATAGLRKEMEKREVVVRSRDHAATRKLAQAEKLATLEGRVPIHPQSQLAKAARDAARPSPVKLVEVDDKAAKGFEMLDMSRNPFDHD